MRKLVIIVLIFVVIPIVWYRISFPTVSYRYRLSIAVESDGQVHSGSSVIEVGITFFPHWAAALSNGNQLHSTDRGQAVLIDLGARGVLVAALRGENYDYSTVDARELPGRAFFPSLVQRNASGIPATPANERAIAQMKGRVDLAMDNMPAFFWFSDPANPATAKLVKPENFASVIGDSTRLVSAQVEITYDPVAIDIDKKLPVYATLTAPPNNGLYTAPGGLVVGAGMFMSRGD